MHRHYARKGHNCLFAASGRAIAEVGRDANGRVFATKTVRRSVHFLRRPEAIALDKVALAQAAELGVCYLRVFEQDAGLVYTTPITNFQEHVFELDRGFGLQVGLPLSWWTVGVEPSVSPSHPAGSGTVRA